MFRHIFNHKVPYPRPIGFTVPEKGTYTGLDSIAAHGLGTAQSPERTGRVRCVAIRQQEQLYKDLKQLQRDQALDHANLDHHYAMKMQDATAQYRSNLRCLGGGVYSNGDVLLAKRLAKCHGRRIKALRKERERNRRWLDLWFDGRVVRIMGLLRREWEMCGSCAGFPYWGDGARGGVVGFGMDL
ncbi:hypothetical protein CORC01_11604 [Colletotrichum orchidophilum]|uniref:Uncharacterized protein n=1 Tax=Colletotrichum orchidophilum TaxID=1209926 RepID=A0A1G4AVI7_9PEZI|nr:uncharacterized protein CORC01_11604 [Colletotrichum orchidophilum]OHE93115.1 hypothetical protein CORC01_11604 [Colletotrichum orchidophilum]